MTDKNNNTVGIMSATYSPLGSALHVRVQKYKDVETGKQYLRFIKGRRWFSIPIPARDDLLDQYAIQSLKKEFDQQWEERMERMKQEKETGA